MGRRPHRTKWKWTVCHMDDDSNAAIHRRQVNAALNASLRNKFVNILTTTSSDRSPHFFFCFSKGASAVQSNCSVIISSIETDIFVNSRRISARIKQNMEFSASNDYNILRYPQVFFSGKLVEYITMRGGSRHHLVLTRLNTTDWLPLHLSSRQINQCVKYMEQLFRPSDQ